MEGQPESPPEALLSPRPHVLLRLRFYGATYRQRPVESAAKNIAQARLKRSGIRWSRSGGQHVLNLLTYLKSTRWDVMWTTITKAA